MTISMISFTAGSNGAKMVAIEENIAVGLGLHKSMKWQRRTDGLPGLPNGIVHGTFLVAKAADVVAGFRDNKSFSIADGLTGCLQAEEAAKADGGRTYGHLDLELIGFNAPAGDVETRIKEVFDKFEHLGANLRRGGMSLNHFCGTRFTGIRVWGLKGGFFEISWPLDGTGCAESVLKELDALEARLQKIVEAKEGLEGLLKEKGVDYIYLAPREDFFSVYLIDAEKSVEYRAWHNAKSDVQRWANHPAVIEAKKSKAAYKARVEKLRKEYAA